MNDFRRSTATLKLRDVQAMLEQAKYVLPEDVATAFQRLDTLETLRPAERDAQTLRKAYVDGADAKEIDRHALDAVAYGLKRGAWSEAHKDAGSEGLSVVRLHVDDIIEHLRKRAETAVADLMWWGEAKKPSPALLLQNNKLAEAKRASNIENTFADFQVVRKIRAAVSPERFPWGLMAFANFDDHTGVNVGDLGFLTDAIAEGGRLWWPSWSEALHAQSRLERTAAEKAQAEQAEHRAIRRMAV